MIEPWFFTEACDFLCRLTGAIWNFRHVFIGYLSCSEELKGIAVLRVVNTHPCNLSESARYRHADRQHAGISSRFRQPHAPSPCWHQVFLWDIITLDKGHTNILRLFCQWLGPDSVLSRKKAHYKVPLR